MRARRVTMLAVGGLMAVSVPACKKDRGETVKETLSEAGYDFSQGAHFRAAESDDLSAMERMLEGGIEFDVRDNTRRTALHAAAGAGAIKAIDFLLDRGLDVDPMDAGGQTPLMEAVIRSTPETVRYLLRQGADPQIKDNLMYKPLMLAVRDGRSEMVPELAPYVRGDLDDALLAAAILGQAGVIDELTNFGASIYARLEDGRTPLMLAAQNGRTEAVEMLLVIGANRFAMDGEGRMAADFAKMEGHAALASRLAEEPQEGDFELQEPAELGQEMASAVVAAGGDSLAGSGQMEPAEGDAGSELSGIVGGGSADAETGTALADGGTAPGIALVEAAEPRASGARVPVESLEGAIVEGRISASPPGGRAAAGGADQVAGAGEPAPIVMRAYRERELPLRVVSASAGSASIRIPGVRTVEVAEGSTIPGTSLEVIGVSRRMQSGKEGGGAEVEVSVVEVKDTNSGRERELTAGLPALAHDPVALIEDAAGGNYYVARTGQRFRGADGEDYLVGDVRPTQVVIENMRTRETTTIPLRGPRG